MATPAADADGRRASGSVVQRCIRSIDDGLAGTAGRLGGGCRCGSLMAAPSLVYTAAYVARLLGEDQALIEEIAFDQMEPEDGRLRVIDSDGQATSIMAFTDRGIDCLRELLAIVRYNARSAQR